VLNNFQFGLNQESRLTRNHRRVIVVGFSKVSKIAAHTVSTRFVSPACILTTTFSIHKFCQRSLDQLEFIFLYMAPAAAAAAYARGAARVYHYTVLWRSQIEQTRESEKERSISSMVRRIALIWHALTAIAARRAAIAKGARRAANNGPSEMRYPSMIQSNTFTPREQIPEQRAHSAHISQVQLPE